MPSISWLHLTDLHFNTAPHSGMASQRWLWPNVREEFFRDLERVHRYSGPWDLVLFSGDLAQSGTEADYLALDKVFTQLWEQFKRLECDPVLLAVPGNHDLQWPDAKSGTVRAMRSWHADRGLRDIFWADDTNEFQGLIQAAFRSYTGWWDRRALPANVSWQRGILPGDFSASYEKDGLTLGIVGLNSAFLQLGKGVREGQLDLHPRQLHEVCAEDPVAWTKAHHINVLMTHHPPKWLAPEAQKHLQSEIAPGDRFLLHLFGHMHEPVIQSCRRGGGGMKRELQGASLFGLESWETPEGHQVERIHGYTAGRFEVEGKQGTLRLWPRKLIWLHSGEPRMVADQPQGLDEQEAITDPFRLKGRVATRPLARTDHRVLFLREYRRRFSAFYDRWDLGPTGVAQAGAAGRPIEATLDNMYVPLRLGEGYDFRQLTKGRVLTPENLQRRKQPLAIRGTAGSGKTTWMRWMFRRLLRDEKALPIMMELRRLARIWYTPGQPDPERFLDAYLETLVVDQLGEVYRGRLREIFSEKGDLQPVLLVDGWDELGELGEELRRKLVGFMQDYPRVQVVVTSRPYGQGRPSHSEGFQVLDIQPLSDGEIEDLACRFFTHCYGEEQRRVHEAAADFLQALQRSSDASALARTPLLLTMMLLVSRSRPLPDQRHQLYQLCIENLLTALPDRRHQEGALLLDYHWRPENSQERFREVARLAFRAQTEASQDHPTYRTVMARTWNGMDQLLPEHWSATERTGFLAWLAGPAGVLTDQADGTLAFTHLSFQEYLAAWHLNATFEGDADRIALCSPRLPHLAWWETLRLWAALVEAPNPERLQPVLQSLLDDHEHGFWLAGAMLADGLGASIFPAWAQLLSEALHSRWVEYADYSSQAWAASRQEERRSMLGAALSTAVVDYTWFHWLRCRSWTQTAHLPIDLPLPRQGTHASVIMEAWAGQITTARHVAMSRCLLGSSLLWPGIPVELVLLSLWPSRRRLAGITLQALATFGTERPLLLEVARTYLRMRHDADWARAAQSTFARDTWSLFFQEIARLINEKVEADFASDFRRDFSLFSALMPVSAISNVMVIEFPNIIITWSSSRVTMAYNQESRVWEHYWASADLFDDDCLRLLLEQLGLSEDTPVLRDFALFDSSANGRFASRAFIAHFLKDTSPRARLMVQAAHLSLRPASDPSLFQAALEAYPRRGDPLWPALARHIARRPLREDRPLLEAFAQSPARRKPPLSWGLQYIIRGDVVLHDGSLVTLDELCDTLDLPHLPYLEDLPDELEGEWPPESSEENTIASLSKEHIT